MICPKNTKKETNSEKKRTNPSFQKIAKLFGCRQKIRPPAVSGYSSVAVIIVCLGAPSPSNIICTALDLIGSGRTRGLADVRPPKPVPTIWNYGDKPQHSWNIFGKFWGDLKDTDLRGLLHAGAGGL